MFKSFTPKAIKHDWEKLNTKVNGEMYHLYFGKAEYL